MYKILFNVGFFLLAGYVPIFMIPFGVYIIWCFCVNESYKAPSVPTYGERLAIDIATAINNPQFDGLMRRPEQFTFTPKKPN